MKLINFRTAINLIITYLESSNDQRKQMLSLEFRDALIVVNVVVNGIRQEAEADEEPCEKELESPWESNAPVKDCSMCGLPLSFREERDELAF